MSSTLQFYRSPGGITAVHLPFDLTEVVAHWSGLRRIMARQKPESYTRDEWAYLISFLDAANLKSPFEDSFGEPAQNAADGIVRLLRPRGRIGIWLPGNVSLLGPLTVILLSLTGNRIRTKGTPRAEDLTGVFLEFARAHLPEGALRHHLTERVRHEVFDRTDPRNQETAAAVDVRIVFGSDDAVQSIHALDHPVDSVGFSFADRQSEAWLEKDAVSDEMLSDLIKVFAIYGQAGCTSPRRVVILGATSDEATAVRDRVRALWADVLGADPAAHVASENVMSMQCAAAHGWDAVLAPRNAAVLAAGALSLEPFPGRMALTFVPASLEEAIQSLPERIQTIGHGFSEPRLGGPWLDVLAQTGVKRMVPLARMHHFGPVWDGQAYWRQSFDEVEVAQ